MPLSEFGSWKKVEALVVTERALWSSEGPVAIIAARGGRETEKTLWEPVPTEHLSMVRAVMAQTIIAATQAGYALIDQREGGLN